MTEPGRRRWWRPAWAARLFVRVLLLPGLLILAAMLADRLYPPVLDRLNDLSVTVADRDGQPLRVFTSREGFWRLPAAVDAVEPRFVDLLLAYEDRRFFDHYGVDPLAVLRAAGQNLTAGRVVSGASTITMQVARLLEPRPRTLSAKLVEAARALQLEWRYDKQQILGFYLTLAPYGGNVEGIRAASLTLFGKEPGELTLAEGALLVALPQAPARLRPDRAPGRARAARDKVLARAEEAGQITSRARIEAMEEAVPDRRLALPFHAPHLALAVRDGRYGAVAGQTVLRTTLNGDLQRSAEALARDALGGLHGDANVAMMVMDNRDRSVLVHVGSADALDRIRRGAIDLTRAPRSPGSTLKPFIYGIGFDDGVIHPLTRLNDVSTRFGEYAPRNFARDFSGELTVAEALQRSLNVPAVLVLDRVGPLRFTGALQRAGVTLRLPPGATGPGLPIALGGASTSLWDLMSLYAALARGGMVSQPVVLAGDDQKSPVRFLSATTAHRLRSILEAAPPPSGVVQDPLAGRTGPIALKTGTSYGFRDAWAFGVTGHYTAGVWIGRPDGSPSPDHFGRNTAAPLLHKLFDRLPADRGRPAGPLLPEDRPPSLLARLNAGEQSLLDANRRPADRPRLTFPVNATVIEAMIGTVTGDRTGSSEAQPVTLTAVGGKRPLFWLINGKQVGVSPLHRRIDWWPEMAGRYRITVLDSDGRSDSVDVQLR